MGRRREGGECVGKGWGAWVWWALCLRQAARGRAPAGRSPVGAAGVGGRCDGQRGESVGVPAGRALGNATVGVGGGEGGGVVVGGGVRRLCGGGWGGGGECRVDPPPACLLAWLGGRGGLGGGGRAGGVGCGLARCASTLGRPAVRRRRGPPWRRRPAPKVAAGSAAGGLPALGLAAAGLPLSTTSTVPAAQRSVPPRCGPWSSAPSGAPRRTCPGRRPSW